MTAARPIVIAHRGASAYLPEHTLAAKALAFGMGADYLEQDIVASADDELIVLHDIHLDRVTDAGERYPGRARPDGRYYARDFTLAELRTLTVTERLNAAGDAAHYPRRFPAFRGRFGLVTLAEELAFIAGLERASGRRVGIYPEIKRPAWHRGEGIELGDEVLSMLQRHGFTEADSPCYVQCFDFAETVRLRRERGCRLRLIQLVGENGWDEAPTDFDWLQTAAGLREVAAVADGIGPWLGQVLPGAPDAAPLPLTAAAHAAGLLVHPYTFRADDLPPGFVSLEQALDYALTAARVDGFFTDFPDRGVAAVDALAARPAAESGGTGRN